MTHVLIELNQIDSRATREAEAAAQRAAYASRPARDDSFYRDTDELGENGEAEVAEAQAEAEASTPAAVAEVLRPALIDPMDIRTVTHRRGGKPGVRITFSNGGGAAFAESYDELKAKLREAGIHVLNRTEPQLLTSQS